MTFLPCPFAFPRSAPGSPLKRFPRPRLLLLPPKARSVVDASFSSKKFSAGHFLDSASSSMAMKICCNNVATCLVRSKEARPEEAALPRVEKMLVGSIEKLQSGASVDAEEASFIAKLVYDSMTTGGRVYHAMQHVFDISKTMEDPILVLSALFHDVVYYSIDKGFIRAQQEIIKDIVVSEGEQLFITSDFNGDQLMEKYVKVYGFTPGEPVPKLGTNEFISGVIGIKILSKWLSESQLKQVAACIEATIPFRPVVNDKTPMDRLYDRLKSVCPDQSEEWLVATIHKAAATANFDLCSFDSEDRNFFLDSSWKLIPEARPALLDEDCPLLEWMNELKALEGRTIFLKGNVHKIFQGFRQVPSEEEMAEKQRKTHDNLDVMWEYGKVRQLQAMVLVAVVEAMGENPASFPLRSCLTMDVPGLVLEARDPLTPTEQEVRNWLVGGRRACFGWDPAISPLGAYLFDSLGPAGIAEATEIGKNQKHGSHDLLKFLPKEVVVTVSARLGAVFTDRAEGFYQVPEKLGILAQ